MRANGFTILITSDRNLQYQQNLEKYEIVVMVLVSLNNRYNTLKEYIPLIEKNYLLKRVRVYWKFI